MYTSNIKLLVLAAWLVLASIPARAQQTSICKDDPDKPAGEPAELSYAEAGKMMATARQADLSSLEGDWYEVMTINREDVGPQGSRYNTGEDGNCGGGKRNRDGSDQDHLEIENSQVWVYGLGNKDKNQGPIPIRLVDGYAYFHHNAYNLIGAVIPKAFFARYCRIVYERGMLCDIRSEPLGTDDDGKSIAFFLYRQKGEKPMIW